MIKTINLNTTSNGGLDKPSMITVMKLIGDFSKKKQLEVTLENQIKRLEEFNKNEDKYISLVSETLEKEEENIQLCTTYIL